VYFYIKGVGLSMFELPFCKVNGVFAVMLDTQECDLYLTVDNEEIEVDSKENVVHLDFNDVPKDVVNKLNKLHMDLYVYSCEPSGAVEPPTVNSKEQFYQRLEIDNNYTVIEFE
jgi:hypothetical protein